MKFSLESSNSDASPKSNAHDDQRATPSQGSSPILSRWPGIAVMVLLLIMAGLSASVVGYRVKSAEWERTKGLLAEYERLGGSFEMVMTPSASALAASAASDFTPQQRQFIAMYEVNHRAKDYGLSYVIENTPRDRLDLAAVGFLAIGALDAAHLIRDTLTAIDETKKGEAPSNSLLPARALRLAKKYGRSTARETEARLYLTVRPQQ